MNALVEGASMIASPTNLLAVVALGLFAGRQNGPLASIVLFALGLLAGSLAMLARGNLDRALVFRALVQQLDCNYESLTSGLEEDLEARWRWHSGLLGKHVTITTQGKTYRGRLLDLGFAAVELQEAEGNIRRLAPDLLEAITPWSLPPPPP